MFLTDIYITTGNLTWKEESEGRRGAKVNVISVVRFGLERGVGEKAALNAASLTAALHNSFQIFPATPRARGGD